MDTLLGTTSGLLGDEGAARIAFLVLVALAAFALSAGFLGLFAGASDPLRRRLAALTRPAEKQSRGAETIVRMLAPVSRYVLPRKDVETARVAAQLQHAGLRSPNALTVFYAVKLLLAALMPAAALFALRWFPEVEGARALFGVAVAAFTGIMLPNLVLQRLIARRMRALRNGFPDALDLLVVCVEAGLGLSAALQRVARELEVSHPELAQELSMVGAETRAGVDRVTALRHLSDRTGLEDIRGLTTLLAQTMRFGTSIADTLRVYSEEFRDKRMQAAEEQAAKIGTKLIFPLTFCMFPAFFIVAIGPAVLKVMAAFGG